MKTPQATAETGEDGLKVLQELVNKYDKVTDEVIRAAHGEARQHQREPRRTCGRLLHEEDARPL